MLRQRLITSSIAGICIIAGLLLLPAWFIVAFVFCAIGVAGWEWARLAGLDAAGERIGYGAAVACLMLIPAGVLPGLGVLALPWLSLAVLVWLLVTLWLVLGARPRSDCHGRRWGWLLLGLGLVPALGGALAWLVATGEIHRGVILYCVALVWAADSGAYFIGRACGRHRLAPGISAGKTWEGAAGGIAAVMIYAVAGGLLLGVPMLQLPLWIALAMVAAVVSIVGDLFESVLKREAGVKDSGYILPGHGGLLDRIDSLMAALPVMVLGLAWFPGVGT